MSELYTASQQWATRPDDQRYWDLDEMIRDCNTLEPLLRTGRKDRSDRILWDHRDGEIGMRSKDGRFFPLSHWAFQQVASERRCPVNFLRRLKAETAVACLRDSSPELHERVMSIVMRGQEGVIRSYHSNVFTRVRNLDVLVWLKRLQVEGS